ncbi:MAG: M14 family zinc carboxypeptidase, partial [Saprospiraceae bacterium]|nr:M14 family zinc carboxypeptidase [Saprospiraceae bacterium]
MQFKNYLLVLLLGSYFQITAQSVDLNYYLPDIPLNETISTPEEFLGYQVGDWHVSHDQLHYYMKHVASQSDRIVINEIGRTHENRPLLNLIITSPENHSKLDQIKANHRSLTDPNSSASADIENIPVVIYQGYS